MSADDDMRDKHGLPPRGEDRPMKVYIAGPMTGIPDWNFPAFFDAEQRIRDLGHDPVNPAHNDGTTLADALASAGQPDRPAHTWAWYMQRDLPHVCQVDALCLLPGWRDSRGAQLEVHVARALGLPLLVLTHYGLQPRVRIVGLSGYARSGKDTVGGLLVDKGWERASFAAPLKEAMYRLDPTVSYAGIAHQSLAKLVDSYGWELVKDHVPEARRLLQRMGTEVGRQMFGPDFWVDLAMRSMPDGARVVVTDCRFPNEADAVKAAGGQVWRIERPGFAPTNAHPSETALDGYDFDRVIVNDGTVDDLRAAL